MVKDKPGPDKRERSHLLWKLNGTVSVIFQKRQGDKEVNKRIKQKKIYIFKQIANYIAKYIYLNKLQTILQNINI